jgi:hypothetical protein
MAVASTAAVADGASLLSAGQCLTFESAHQSERILGCYMRRIHHEGQDQP